jgi:hypothetical protein
LKTQGDPAARLYRSTGHPGYSPAISGDARRVIAHKREAQVQVEFAAADCTVRSIEGEVRALAGDAIITAATGERWRVSRGHFAQRYAAVAPTCDGEAGTYRSLPRRVIAIPMPGAFQVQLADGASLLSGVAGDWLVDYGDGSLGIVAKAIFRATYDVAD